MCQINIVGLKVVVFIFPDKCNVQINIVGLKVIVELNEL